MRRLFPALLLGIATASAAQPDTDQQRALTATQAQAERAASQAARFEREATRAVEDAARARRAAAALDTQVRASAADIRTAEVRLRAIALLQARQRARLARLQLPITRLGAALQTMARRSPALALVQPGSTADIVHVRALLAAGVPVIRARSRAVRGELARADRLADEAAAATAGLLSARDRLHWQQRSLIQLAAGQRARSGRLVDAAMFEQDRAAALGEQARDIVDLLDRIDDQSSRAQRLAALPGPIPRPAVPGLPPASRFVPARIASPIAGYRMPVRGRIVIGMGELSDAGIRARGVTIETRPAARVLAPTRGRIAFAGHFRGYGGIAIIDHGAGWTTLITGLGTTMVEAGRTVAAGAPIGTARTARPQVTLELRHHGRPVDVMPLGLAAA